MNMKEKSIIRANGVIPLNQKGYYSVRILSKVGYFSVKDLNIISNISEIYGNGEVNLTTRLAIEIPFISYDSVDKVKEIAKENNLIIGGGGSTVRAILSCKGDVCRNGLTDTRSLAKKLDEEFFGIKLPGKFKIAVLGCANGYGRAQGNDLSIMPLNNVEIKKENCIGCNKCVKICPDKALEIHNGKVILNKDKCLSCGKCIKECPKNAIVGEAIDFKVLIGGRMGRKFIPAKVLNRRFKEEEILLIVGNIIKFYECNANKQERFASLIERLGFEKVQQQILNM